MQTTTLEEVRDALAQAGARGLSLSALAGALGLAQEGRPRLLQLLDELRTGGELGSESRRFVLLSDGQGPQPSGTRVSGVLQVTPGGRGFVAIGEAFDDVLVRPTSLGPALDGDRVEVVCSPARGGNGLEGEVVAVLERGRTRVVGNLVQAVDGTLSLLPDDIRLPSPMPVSGAGQGGAGQAVLATITAYPRFFGDSPQVTVSRVLGEAGQLVAEVAKAVAGAGVDEALPAEVLAAAAQVPDQVDPAEATRREDLRHLHFVTIDPLSARDFDDAVAVERRDPHTYRVWVAVADVSHYVTEDSPIDLEARRRGTSLYLPDRAIHMLPERLSAGICSLAPGVDRLAMVVRLDIGGDGQVRASACSAAIIHSRGRLDYSGVAAALTGDFAGRRQSYLEHAAMLEDLGQVAASLRAARLARGSLDLDLPEARVVLDEDDPCRVRDIVHSQPDQPVKRAYNLIEELMVAANEAVGRAFEAADLPTIWRVHAPPAREAAERLALWLQHYGITADPDSLVHPAALSRVLLAIQGHRAARPLSYQVLRTLKQAIYARRNIGHFGLASRTYLHFTSPIRRYPDLHVHRLLKQLLAREGKLAGPFEVRQSRAADLETIAAESSRAERRAVELEREVRSLYAASLMRDRIGDRQWGLVTGVTQAGLFVSLDHPAVEGLVRAETLGRDTRLLPEHLRLLVRTGRRVFSLGDRVWVEVVDTSVLRRQVDLRLVPEPTSHEPDPDLPPGLFAPPPRHPGERRHHSQRDKGHPKARNSHGKNNPFPSKKRR